MKKNIIRTAIDGTVSKAQ